MNTIPPLTAQLNDLETFKCVRRILGQFYSAIKTMEGKLRFLFVTGITKFSQTSIFSELNITDDFSFASEYSALLGYEEDEIDRYFSGYVKRAARELSLSENDVRERLRLNYDGYCFDADAVKHVYNHFCPK